jgi:polar amino acid transport system substrate-binding protein
VVAVGPGAHHATLGCARRSFCARIPRPELARDASAGALVGVALHAMHRAGIEGGADAAVLGLGVIGQFMVQALRAAGCRVVAFDPLVDRRALAAAAGAEAHAAPFPRAGSFDAVFLCARADAPDVVASAVSLCRRRARMVVVGEFPIELPREAAYAREVELLVSAGYGDDRYAGDALPASRVGARPPRTVAHNLEAFLRGLDEGRISPSRLDPRVLPFGGGGGGGPGAVLTFYEYAPGAARRACLELPHGRGESPGALGVALVGPGRFAREVHLPNLRAMPALFRLRCVVGHSPLGAREAAARFGVARATCDLGAALGDPGVSALVVCTPHAAHAATVERALSARKHVFVEKPLGLSLAEVARVGEAARAAPGTVLFVGFNRRFAPASLRIASDLARGRGPLNVSYTFCQDPLPPGEWAGLPEHGGGFVGEVCHAVDWICWLVGAPVAEKAGSAGADGAAGVQLRFADGSRALLAVRPRSAPGEPKERVEVACGDAAWITRDFADLEVRQRDAVRERRGFEGKGSREALEAFAAAIADPPPGEDPFGFLASGRLVIELDAMLRGA